MDNIQQAIKKLRIFKDLTMEVCGTWLWIGGNTEAHRKILSAVGAQLAPRKGRWYVRPAGAPHLKREERAMADIRAWFGSETVR